MSSTVTVELGARAYPIVVGSGILAQVAEHLPPHARHALVVTQPPVGAYADTVGAALAAAGLHVARVEVRDGEGAKDLSVLELLYARCAELPLGRDDLVIAVGGGVVGDLAGFLAATWNRGVAVIQVPTTLLAQVDAAIGGKTGINLPAGKNLVGAFHQPSAVVADIDSLASLAPRVRVEGLAEVVKYGLTHDPVILELLEADPDAARRRDPRPLRELVERSAAVKAAVVAADEREAGERAHLNLGHTFGHALEALTGYRELLHGEAVAIGIAAALELGVGLGRTSRELADRGVALLAALGLPTRAPTLERQAVWDVMGRDKKVRGGVRFVVLDGLGAPALVAPDRADVDAAIDAVTG